MVIENDKPMDKDALNISFENHTLVVGSEIGDTSDVNTSPPEQGQRDSVSVQSRSMPNCC